MLRLPLTSHQSDMREFILYHQISWLTNINDSCNYLKWDIENGYEICTNWHVFLELGTVFALKLSFVSSNVTGGNVKVLDVVEYPLFVTAMNLPMSWELMKNLLSHVVYITSDLLVLKSRILLFEE